jgi:predicted phage-related endonuclease
MTTGLTLDGIRGPETPAMRRGRYFESGIASMWSDDHGLALLKPAELYIYDEVFVATLDRIVVGTATIVEIKSVRYPPAEPYEHWIDQAQVQLLCTDLDEVLLVVFATATDDLVEFRVLPDPERQHELYEATVKFLDAIGRGELPEGTESYDEVREAIPAPERQRAQLDDETMARCSQLASLQHRIPELEVDEDRLKAIIGRSIGDAAEGWFGDRLVATFRTTTRTGVDTKRLRTELPEVFATYRTETTCRTLRLVER